MEERSNYRNNDGTVPGNFFSSMTFGTVGGGLGQVLALGEVGSLAIDCLGVEEVTLELLLEVVVGFLILRGGTSFTLAGVWLDSLTSLCLLMGLVTSLILRTGSAGGLSESFCWLRGGRVISAENLANSREPGWSSCDDGGGGGGGGSSCFTTGLITL